MSLTFRLENFDLSRTLDRAAAVQKKIGSACSMVLAIVRDVLSFDP